MNYDSENKRKEKKEFSSVINFSTANLIGNTNRYRFIFTSPIDLRNKDPTISMSQYAIYNSTYNISASLLNNKFSIL
jgi:hypothetical protein